LAKQRQNLNFTKFGDWGIMKLISKKNMTLSVDTVPLPETILYNLLPPGSNVTLNINGQQRDFQVIEFEGQGDDTVILLRNEEGNIEKYNANWVRDNRIESINTGAEIIASIDSIDGINQWD
jgi:hypothetical protein